jgi:hypothetical protein
MCIGPLVIDLLLLSDIIGSLINSLFVCKILIPNFMKIRQVGGEFFHADGRTEITKP